MARTTLCSWHLHQGKTLRSPFASLLMEQYLKDSVSSKRQPEIEKLANADLIPDAIKHWYYRQDSIKLAKQSQKINPDAAPVFQNNLETSKPVRFDPEAEPDRKDDSDTGRAQKNKSPLQKPDEKKNLKPKN